MKSLKLLKSFANKKAKFITNKPIKVQLDNLPRNSKYEVVARGYNEIFTPDDKKIKPIIVGHGVILDRKYYNQNKNNLYELKQAVLHELVHIKVPTSHGKRFKKIAIKLGIDKTHQKQYWE